ncbi:MAG: phosphatase PAP2 family protein [Sphingobacteriales bacterium]|nr:MAG: phosphatase PAP2 family protein [Sphingobacteriales bacterium]
MPAKVLYFIFDPYKQDMRQLFEIDRHLFQLINSKWHNGFFDTVAPVIRNSITWLPLYLFLLVFAIANFKKKAFWWIVLAACVPILGDLVSSGFLKKTFWRVRPCNEPSLADSMRFLLSYRPQSSSFPSSHAVNHFAMATFYFVTLKEYIGKWAWLFYGWAFIIIYSQVYVGVHYPVDVICGAIIGFVLGYLPARSFNKQFGLQ